MQGLNEEEQESIKALIYEYADVFYVEGRKFTTTTIAEHEIISTNENPIWTKRIRQPKAANEALEKSIQEHLKLGIIERAKDNGGYSNPIWVVPKKKGPDGTQLWRTVVDLRQLKNSY